MKPRTPSPEAHRRYIGIKQAKRTIQKIERRARLGTARPTDRQGLINAQQELRKWESVR